MINAGHSLEDFSGGVGVDYVMAEKAVKVIVPEGLALPKGQVKNSRFRPVDEVEVEELLRRRRVI